MAQDVLRVGREKLSIRPLDPFRHGGNTEAVSGYSLADLGQKSSLIEWYLGKQQ